MEAFEKFYYTADWGGKTLLLEVDLAGPMFYTNWKYDYYYEW